jgi:GMP synthase (glutamine-hydrolysing)
VFLTDAGRAHPMHMGRDLAFDAPAVHSDMVSRLPPGAVATAWNTEAAVQAAEIRWGAGTFWGVQYHPEYALADVAAIIQRYGQRLVTQGFFTDLASLAAYVADLTALHGEPKRFDIAWKLGLGGEVLDPSRRLCEISNWLDHHVRPTVSARGRL